MGPGILDRLLRKGGTSHFRPITVNYSNAKLLFI